MEDLFPREYWKEATQPTRLHTDKSLCRSAGTYRKENQVVEFGHSASYTVNEGGSAWPSDDHLSRLIST